MKARRLVTVLMLVSLLLALNFEMTAAKGGPGGGGGGGGGGETAVGNNLSFPVIYADGFTISAVTQSLTVPYVGPYADLSEEQMAALEGSTWYAQKVEGNTWQAGTLPPGGTVPIYGIDWGDNIEAVNPTVGRPFRLEVVLYKKLDAPATAYTMAVLAFPSSPKEVQGTNGVTFTSDYATVVSRQPALTIQYIQGLDPAALTWSVDRWVTPDGAPRVTPVGFGTELNVAGKYIYGASEGGWKPDQAGVYRITYYIKAPTQLSLGSAIIVNSSELVTPTASILADEGSAATPVVDAANNLTYVDVTVVGKRR